MFISLISTLLLVSRILGDAVESCVEQSLCLSVVRSYGTEIVDICITYNNSLPGCDKDDEISHYCNGTHKFEDVLSPTQMCLQASCDTPADERYVEFGVKDGSGGCIVEDEDGEDDIVFSEDGESWFCRATTIATGPEEESDVLCPGNGNTEECIHKIYYGDCDPVDDPDDPSSTENGGPVETCDEQAPCLSVTYNYTTDGDVRVCVTYDSRFPECQKGGFDEPDGDLGEDISHVCFNDEKEENFASGGEICISGSCDCEDGDNFVEIQFKDGEKGGCTTAGGVVIEGAFDGDSNMANGNALCRPGQNETFCVGGNQDGCIYKIYYDKDECIISETTAIPQAVKNDGHADDNMFGIKNASKGTTIGVFSGIIIAGLCLLGIIAGLSYKYIYGLQNNAKTIQGVTVSQESPIPPESPQSVQSPESADAPETPTFNIEITEIAEA